MPDVGYCPASIYCVSHAFSQVLFNRASPEFCTPGRCHKRQQSLGKFISALWVVSVEVAK